MLGDNDKKYSEETCVCVCIVAMAEDDCADGRTNRPLI